jgi:hypothetical protein
MNTFINLSPKQSKNIDSAIFKNARQLRKEDTLEEIFFIENDSGIKTEIKGDDWKIETIK